MGTKKGKKQMKLSKRILLAVVAMSMAASVVAQNITFTHGDKGNGKGYQPTMIRLDKGDATDVYYSVEPELNAFSRTKGILVREVNSNYKESKSVSVPNTKDCGILHSMRDGSTMHVVINCSENDRFVLRHVSVNLKSFSIEEDKTIVDLPMDKKSYYYQWNAMSPSGNYFGLVYVIVNEKKGTADLKAMLFNRGMERQWEKKMDVSAVTEILVTDDGRIVTGGFSNGEDKNDGAVLTFSIVSEDDVEDARFSSTSKVGELALLNCYGDKVLATFLETERGTGWAGTLAAGAVVTKGTVYTGCGSYLLDVANGKVAGSDHRTFSKEDARVFYSASLVSEITSPDVNFMSCRASTATSYGGVAVYGRTWMERVVQSNGMSSETYYYKGMMVFAVDSTGRFAWVRPLMHDNAMGALTAERTETDVVAEGDNVYLFTNESDNDSPDYDPEKPVRKAVLKGHGAVAAYSFTAEGKVSKQMLELDGFNAIMTRLRRQAPGVYTFITGKLKGCVSEINIKL